MKKRIVSMALTIAVLMSSFACLSGISVSALSSTNQQNIVDRAEYMWNSTWVCKRNVQGWGSMFYAGNTYRIPYGQPIYSGKYIGFGASVDTYLAAAADANSIFYTSQSYFEGTRAPYYANDCSAFVSYAWGCDRKTTYSIPQVSTYIGMATASNNYSLQLGDCLNSNSVGHVVLVTGLGYSNGSISQIEITEQTPPQLKRSYYTPATLGAKYGANYGIYRYNYDVPPAPNRARDAVPKVSNVKATSVTSSGITFSFDAVGSDGLAVDASKVYVWPSNKSWDSAEAKTYGYNDNESNYNGALKKSGNTYSFTVNPANHGNQKGVHYSIGIHNKIGSKWTFDKNYGSLAYMANAVNWGDFSSRITNKTTGTSLAMEGSGNNVVFKTTADTTEQIWQFYRQSDGSYKIMNKKSGKALDVMGAYSTAKTNVQVYNDHGGDAQRWFIEPMGSGYSLRAKCATTCVIDIPDGSKDSGTNAWLYTQNNSAAQTFSITTSDLPKPVVTDIKYYAINSSTFKVGFTAVGEEGSAIQDSSVYVKPSSKGWDSAECKNYSLGANTDNVSYKGAIKSLGNNRYEFTVNVANHGGLKGEYSIGLHVKANGKFFHIGDFNRVLIVPNAVNLGNDFYSRITNKTTGTSLAMEGSGNNVVFKTTADTTEQIWHFTRQSDGSYKIMNKKSNKALDVMGAYSTAKTNVQVYNDHGGEAQRWFIETLGDGYSLRPQCATTCVLDIPNTSKDSGTNAWLYTQNNSAAQTFSIATSELPKPVVTDIEYYDINSSNFKVGFTAVGEEGAAIQDSAVYVKPSSKGWDSAECKTYSLGENTDNVSYKGAIKSLGNNRYEFTANVANHGGLKGEYSIGLHVKSNGKFFHMGDLNRVITVPEKDPDLTLKDVSYSDVTTEGFDVTFSVSVSDGSDPKSITMYAWPSGLTYESDDAKTYGFGNTSVDFPGTIKKLDKNTYKVHVSVKNHGYYSSNYTIGLHANVNGKNYHLGDKTKFVFVTRGDDLGENFTAKVSLSAHPDLFLSSNIKVSEGATEADANVWGWAGIENDVQYNDDQYYVFNRQADGYSYSIKSKRGGYLVFDDAVENFTQIKTRITDEASATKWCVRKIGDYYMISPVSGSSYAMHIRGTQIEQGSKAVLYKTTAAASELFNIEKVSEVVKNDVNGDGAVDIIDVTTIQKYLAGMTDLSAEQQKAADIDGDGEISIKDATKLSKIIAGIG